MSNVPPYFWITLYSSLVWAVPSEWPCTHHYMSECLPLPELRWCPEDFLPKPKTLQHPYISNQSEAFGEAGKAGMVDEWPHRIGQKGRRVPILAGECPYVPTPTVPPPQPSYSCLPSLPTPTDNVGVLSMTTGSLTNCKWSTSQRPHEINNIFLPLDTPAICSRSTLHRYPRIRCLLCFLMDRCTVY